MGCGSCGTGANGKPSGCGSSGGCSSGGCNRMNVFDWLSALPLSDTSKPYPVIEVTFNKGSRKDFYRNSTFNIFDKGDMIAVEGVGGFDIGQVSLTGELVKLQMKKNSVTDTPSIKKVLRPATDEDLQLWQTHKNREQEVMVRSRAIAKQLKLEMKVCEVEIQADGKKATFFYTADQRVDFRELIKVYASEFKVKVEMRQIGARQESAKVGGIGSCGRELCCSTWLTDFKSVNTTAARYQNLSINQTKLSGQCGRLKCCLNYELDTYMDALRVFPDNAEALHTIKGVAFLQKKDIFKSLMWYSYQESNKQYPMTIARVKEILTLNKQGVKPDELQPVELEVASEKKGVKTDVGFVNDVGQISLRALEKSSKKKRGSGNSQGQQKSGGQQAGGNAQQGRQQQQRSHQNTPRQQQAQGGGQQQGKQQQQSQGGTQQGRQQQPKQGQQPRNNNNNNQPKQGQQQAAPRQQNAPKPQPQQQGANAPQQKPQQPRQQQAKPGNNQGQPKNNNNNQAQPKNNNPRPPRAPQAQKPGTPPAES